MTDETPASEPVLLICSVGGSPEPIAASIAHARPARVLLWHSDDTRQNAVAAIQLAAYDQNQADFRRASAPQDLHRCIADMRSLHLEYRAWLARSDKHRVTIDFTGGTKAMSAAMALVAHRWTCRFLYIAGSARTKDGMGTVVTGAETPIQQANPYDILAYQPIEDAAHLFNHGQPSAASQLLDPFIKRHDLAQSVKRQLTAVQHLANAYAYWDAFRHKDAAASFGNVLKSINDLDAALPQHNLTGTLTAHRSLCDELAMSQGKPTRQLIIDLLANADRRARDQRFDDATARLYRATEAIAQLALANDHQIDAANVRLEQIPPSLKERFQPNAKFLDAIKLALQDDYAVLIELQHPLGLKFRELKLDDKETSPLSTRNQSILAHGFAPTTEKAFNALRNPLHELADKPDLTSFIFPQIFTP